MPEPVTAVAGVPLGRLLGAGGEAEVFEVAGRSRVAFKRYRKPTRARAAKLNVMLTHPPAQAAEAGGHVAIAWPIDTVRSASGTVEGFLMPRVDLRRAVPLFQVYNPQSRRKVAGGFSWRYLLRAARNVAAIVASLHDAGYVIGDLNESNFLVTDRALVVLVDCDSMQVRDPTTGTVHHGAVGKAEFLAPELHGADLARTDRTPESDCFALAILVFLLLMEGLHPFAGIWRGRDEPPDIGTRIRLGLFPYRRFGRLRRPPLGLPLSALPGNVRGLIWRTFTSGVRRPRRRPDAHEWTRVLDAAERGLRTCVRSESHVFARGYLRRCPWCRRVDRGLPDPFPGVDGSVVARREPPAAVRLADRVAVWCRPRLRRLATSIWDRAGSRVRFDVGAAVAAGSAAWAVPPLALVAVFLVLPFAVWQRPAAPRGGRLQRWRTVTSSAAGRLRLTWRRGCIVGAAVGGPCVGAATLNVVSPDVATRAAAALWVLATVVVTARREPHAAATIDRSRSWAQGWRAGALWIVATTAMVAAAAVSATAR